MKVVFQHDGILPVLKYGGIERIIFWHMKELAKLGHKVCLIGHPQSKVEDFGIELIPTEKEWEHLIPEDADIIHLFYNYEAKTKIPTINTIQGNGKKGEQFLKNTVFLTKKHASNHASEEYIFNAIDLSEYPFEKKTFNWEHFLFLAKASWSVKNLKHCIDVCKKNKRHLHIAGGKSFQLNRYIHSYGSVGGDKKLEIINRCNAHLFPVRWHEPFGIAIIEAMALGLPVLGSPYGSLPEIISNNDVGRICKTKEELSSYLKEAPQNFSPIKIREYIEEHFSICTHTKKYLEKYSQVIDKKILNKAHPEWVLDYSANDLLPF